MGAEMSDRYRHVKRGSEYILIGYGKMQAEKWLQSAELVLSDALSGLGGRYVERVYADNAEVAIYRSVDDGTLWVRPRAEFEDGRFVPTSAEPQ